MIVLDENVLESQRVRLQAWKVHLCQIGCVVGRKGMDDDEIIPLLRKLRRPTLITRDRDFFRRALASEGYCLAFFDVGPLDVADYVRRLLRQPDFKTWAQRKGCVMRVSSNEISTWRVHSQRMARYPWAD